MKRIVAGLVSALVLAAAGGSAQAANRTLHKDGMTGAEVAAWLQGAGYKAELTRDSEGDPLIRSATSGINFSIFFYDCDDGRCRAIQFSSGLDMDNGTTLAKVNEWNRTKRYFKAFLDDENDPYLQYDVNLSPGGTYEALDDNLELWTTFLPVFAKFVGW